LPNGVSRPQRLTHSQIGSQAVTVSLPSKTLHRAVLLSDGASRLVDPSWEELLVLLDESGPTSCCAGPRRRGR
jgi:hypothetical protein